MKKKADHVLSILFITIITGSGLVTMLLNPIKIAGGVYRGIVNSKPEISVFDKLENGFSLFETRLNTYFIGHNLSINSYGGLQRLMGRTHVDDVDSNYVVLKLKNDYLTFAPVNGNSDYSNTISYISDLNKSCNANGTDFLYVPLISKSRNTNLYPDYYPVKPESNYDYVINSIKSLGVSVLDLEACMEEYDFDLYSLFYRTDHHWTASTGLWVVEQLVKKINSLYEYNLDSSQLNREQFKTEYYNNVYLGSQGKRVGKYYAGFDDFEVIYPEYDTDFHVEYYNLDETRSGDFLQSFIFRENLDLHNPLTLETNMYDTYMDGNHALIKCHNMLAGNDKKCLIILNSYGCVVAPYLALEFSELDCIDVRGFTEKTIEQYVDETDPDLVVYMLTTP